MVWLSPGAGQGHGAETVRDAMRVAGGHATLARAPAELRSVISVFEPLSPELLNLTKRIKDGFDPKRVLNPGRLYAGL